MRFGKAAVAARGDSNPTAFTADLLGRVRQGRTRRGELRSYLL